MSVFDSLYFIASIDALTGYLIASTSPRVHYAAG